MMKVMQNFLLLLWKMVVWRYTQHWSEVRTRVEQYTAQAFGREEKEESVSNVAYWGKVVSRDSGYIRCPAGVNVALAFSILPFGSLRAM